MQYAMLWQHWPERSACGFIYTTVVGVSTTSRCHCVANSQRFPLCSGRGFLPRARPLPVLLVTGGGYLGYHHYRRSGPQEDGAPPHLATPTEVREIIISRWMCRGHILEGVFFVHVRWMRCSAWGIWRSCLTLSCEWWLLDQSCLANCCILLSCRFENGNCVSWVTV